MVDPNRFITITFFTNQCQTILVEVVLPAADLVHNQVQIEEVAFETAENDQKLCIQSCPQYLLSVISQWRKGTNEICSIRAGNSF